jgi:hypothetical protein
MEKVRHLEYDGPEGSPIQFPILVEDTQSKLLPGNIGFLQK